MKKRHLTKKTMLALLFAILLPLGALVATAIAATTTSTNLTVVKDDSGNSLYTVETKNGIINYKTKFVRNETAVLSYHTQYFYFTKERVNGDPTSITHYQVDRDSLSIQEESNGAIINFQIPQYMIEEAIAK